ncbi:response regulator transcription factor [Polynucleobacter sp. MWH-Spelu-300-X4]|uniref:response regulator transcription factor n=1 Tax=Polynucleobacter sp. MWH-Spelu-300-X4 TaxID=2689109 RepID=UPI001BFDC533|nr:response regulator transcription factor [Polynucleobacter sp. MWH-Spelu-300-X4]QWD79432.1 response regulator transcription factor [Polynucleobacter sp. MWH-Spelu-300-X4]
MVNENPYVVLVEDYELLREQLTEFLQAKGFDVAAVDGGEQLNDALKLRLPDILILDLNLPGEDGLSIAKRVRALQPAIGIIMMTARITGADKVVGYESGADVYITKPAKPEELLAAMSNLLIRLQPVAKRDSLWRLRPKENILQSPVGVEVKLTSNELTIVEMLALSSERKVRTDILSSKLGKIEGEFSKNQLEAIISRLRRKIAEVAMAKDVIKSVWGYGYQLCVDCIIE